MTTRDFALWPFQADLVRRVRASLRQHRSVCMVSPTGSGKTAMAAWMSLEVHRQLGKQAAACLYLVHRKELLAQTAATLDGIGLGDAYGYIAAGKPGKPWAPMQIASIPTLVRRLDNLEWLKPTVLFVDEAHHATAYTWARIIRRWPQAFVVGMTATPMRTDDTGLGDMFDALVPGPQISDLAPEYLAPVRTFAVPPSFHMTRMALKAQSAGMTGAVVGKSIENWLKIAPGARTLFFAADIEHSIKIVEKARARGVHAEHIDYLTPDYERARVFDNMRAGKVQVVSNVKLFTEGTDWPECEAVVLARNTGSFVDYRQMNGRMMRRKHDGRPGVLLDLAGNVHLHGLPNEDVEWELERGVEKRKSRAASPNRVCEGCAYVYPKEEPQCPLCGRSPIKPQTVEVEVEVDEVTEVRRTAKPTKRVLSEEIRLTGGDPAALEALRKKYGYHKNWPARMRKVYRLAWA